MSAEVKYDKKKESKKSERLLSKHEMHVRCVRSEQNCQLLKKLNKKQLMFPFLFMLVIIKLQRFLDGRVLVHSVSFKVLPTGSATLKLTHHAKIRYFCVEPESSNLQSSLLFFLRLQFQKIDQRRLQTSSKLTSRSEKRCQVIVDLL